jgi:hypothetical protein
MAAATPANGGGSPPGDCTHKTALLGRSARRQVLPAQLVWMWIVEVEGVMVWAKG